MIQTTYISTPTRPMTSDDLMNILNNSRLNNACTGVSGMLLYTGSEFIQILEGEDKVIEDLLDTIKHDPRHRDFRIIEKKKITNREYAEWTMGFKRIDKDDLRDVPGLNKFFDTDLSGSIDSNKLNLINNLLNHFRNEGKKKNIHDELSLDQEDKFIYFLHSAIRFAVKALALLMMLTVLWCVLDVVVVIYQEILSQPITSIRQVRDIACIRLIHDCSDCSRNIHQHHLIYPQRCHTGKNGRGDSTDGGRKKNYCFRFP